MLDIPRRTAFSPSIRIAIVSSHAEQRKQLCARFAGTSVCADAVAAVSELDASCEDVNLVLVHDESGNVAEAVRWSLANGPVPVFVYCPKPSVDQIVRSMKVGACEYLEWPLGDESIHRIVGQAVLGLSESTQVRQRMARSSIERLSSRERQVLLALSTGLTSQQIANDLAISPRTVETHRYNLRRKLGSIRTAEAIRLAFENGLDDKACAPSAPIDVGWRGKTHNAGECA
jgi:two-component system response regulator FixJ